MQGALDPPNCACAFDV